MLLVSVEVEAFLRCFGGSLAPSIPLHGTLYKLYMRQIKVKLACDPAVTTYLPYLDFISKLLLCLDNVLVKKLFQAIVKEVVRTISSTDMIYI